MAETVMAPKPRARRRGMHVTLPTAMVVDAIASAQGRAWGSVICATTGLGTGTVYQILHRLEARGLLASEPEPDGEPRDPDRMPGPPRRFYELTGQGREQLLELVAAKLERHRVPAR